MKIVKNKYKSVVDIEIPSTVKDISGMFYNMMGSGNLTSVDLKIPTTITDMSNMFLNNPKLTHVSAIPSHITNIENAFWACTSLKTIEINGNPTQYSNALRESGITTITGSISEETKTAILATK